MVEGLERRVARVEAALRRQRLFTYLRLAVYALLIIGVIVYVVGLYSSMDEWRVEPAGPPRLGVQAPPVMIVEAPIRIYNPDGNVLARMVYYKVYINGYYAGDGFIPYLRLQHGWSEHTIRLEVDLSRAGCGLAKALSTGENLTVRVEGLAMVDLKAFGKIPWRTVTVPFNTTAYEVPPPSLDPATRSILQLTVYLCNNSQRIITLLQSLQNATSYVPGLPGIPGGGGGGNTSTAPVNVTATWQLAPPGFNLTITISNPGPEPVTIEQVKVNGATIYQGPATLGPGESMSVTARVPVLPALVEVETDRGTVTLLAGTG